MALAYYQQNGGQKIITGLSTDTKPASPDTNWIFWETDTGKSYFVSGGVWTCSSDASYAPALGADDNYVTDAEKTKLANLSGTNTGDQTLPIDSTITTTDNTTNNASTSKHGWFPKLPTAVNKFLRDDMTWQNPPGGSEAFPVGAVFIAVVSTDPATLLGYGTWSAIAAGKMLVGLDSGDTDFDTVEETGGAKTKTIAQANLPNISTGAGTAHTHTQNAHTHAMTNLRGATTGGGTTGYGGIVAGSDTSSTVTPWLPAETTATNQNESSHTHSLGGSGTALDVMNPYFVVYMWKRVS